MSGVDLARGPKAVAKFLRPRSIAIVGMSSRAGSAGQVILQSLKMNKFAGDIHLVGRTDEPITIVFWFAVWSTAAYTLTLPFFMSAHTAWQWSLLIAIGVLGCAAQLLLTASLDFTRFLISVPTGCLDLVLRFLLGLAKILLVLAPGSRLGFGASACLVG